MANLQNYWQSKFDKTFIKCRLISLNSKSIKLIRICLTLVTRRLTHTPNQIRCNHIITPLCMHKTIMMEALSTHSHRTKVTMKLWDMEHSSQARFIQRLIKMLNMITRYWTFRSQTIISPGKLKWTRTWRMVELQAL